MGLHKLSLMILIWKKRAVRLLANVVRGRIERYLQIKKSSHSKTIYLILYGKNKLSLSHYQFKKLFGNILLKPGVST